MGLHAKIISLTFSPSVKLLNTIRDTGYLVSGNKKGHVHVRDLLNEGWKGLI